MWRDREQRGGVGEGGSGEKGHTGVKGHDRNLLLAQVQKKVTAGIQGWREGGGGGRHPPSHPRRQTAVPPKRTSVLWVMRQYLFPGIPVHVPIIKTLGKMFFSIHYQVSSPRLPACLQGLGPWSNRPGGSDGGPLLGPADTRELSQPARTAAPSLGRPLVLIFILMVGLSGPGWGLPCKLASGLFTAYGLRHPCKTHSSGDKKKTYAKLHLGS